MKLLVAEDEPMLAELVRRALAEQGHVVDVATDGANARILALVNE
jgi:DNA-binding response OmpR family regulator